MGAEISSMTCAIRSRRHLLSRIFPKLSWYQVKKSTDFIKTRDNYYE